MTAFTLPRHFRRALSAAAILVPAEAREDWLRLWHAELWHATHERPSSGAARAFDLTLGLISDAAWLRAEGLRLRFSGSPTLCLTMLATLCVIAGAFAFRLSGLETRSLFLSWLTHQFLICFCPAVVVAAVGQLGLPRDRQRHSSASRWTLDRIYTRIYARILRAGFLSLKLTLVSIFVFLLGVNSFAALPGLSRAVIPQIYFTAVILAAAIRWSSIDQQRRCRSCLHMLTTPARVGRPSHNFLEWNGTESTCRHGHGALHQPELETSWHEASLWVIS